MRANELKIGQFFSFKSLETDTLTVYLTDHQYSEEITAEMAVEILTFLIREFKITPNL